MNGVGKLDQLSIENFGESVSDGGKHYFFTWLM